MASQLSSGEIILDKVLGRSAHPGGLRRDRAAGGEPARALRRDLGRSRRRGVRRDVLDRRLRGVR